MKALEISLKREGYDVINWHYHSKDKTIEEHAEELVDYLEDLACRHPGDKISLITHSLGGIIARVVVNHPRCPNEVHEGKAILIAPPNRGSELARRLGKIGLVKQWLGEKAGAQLIQTQRDGFDHFGEFPMSMPVLVIAGTLGVNPMLNGPHDGKVLVEETYLKREHERFEVKAGHSWITYHPKVIAKAKEFMSED